jgi:hypothetical protein
MESLSTTQPSAKIAQRGLHLEVERHTEELGHDEAAERWHSR